MAVAIIINVISNLIEDYIRMLENLNYSVKAKQMKEQIAEKSIIKSAHGKIPFRFHEQIDISNLSFTYPNIQIESLKNINLTINKGELIAVLGENGSGKTTLVKLLLGLYKVECDSIFYDGIPINQFDENSLYNNTSAVFQDFIKYQTNVRDNIAVGDITYVNNDEKLESALNRVLFDNHFPGGLNTKLGYIDQDSTNLSGGQWQRLALSRVFVKDNPELIIFDEPTSAMDPLSEMRILNEVLRYCKNTTTIMISHRVGIARKADKICVLQQGQIVEFGTHDELIKSKRNYYEMWMSQKEWYEDVEDKIPAS
ncbi:ABC transporter ATP-binding protein [Cohnella faecalis]|uniref:ABC transporter ATP-binding protein n=2 Tax=Cohnella faecalis TaxID=2315694 RepID=A0A398CRZ3_9BACL|nr:ABC transporter ATP-binding protein [Cohnella faecalis]